MRRTALICLAGCLATVLATPARAQTPPVAQQPPPAPTPAPGAPAAPAAPAAALEETRSLFDVAPRQFQLGGRFSSVDGDPARWQRYGDFRDGLLFTDAKFASEDAAGHWLFRATADNVGWRDQRYVADYERVGRMKIRGFWDSIPQFYSVDTKTPYTTSSGALVLDDATQQSIQAAQAGLSAYIPLAPQFELHERRDIGAVSMTATPSREVDLSASFTSTKHSGELPWGSSFGFSNDVEVALPYDSRTNDFTVSAEWATRMRMLRVAYTGSWFENLDPELVWDSPLRLDDSTSAPGRGRMALWPSNSAQTISMSGFAKFARRSQVTGSVSFGFWNNDEPLQPFTINATLPQIALPRATAQADAGIFSTNVSFVSRPATDWRLGAKLRIYDYNNHTPHSDIPQFINYDTSVKDSSTGGPEPYAHSRTTFDADATWTGLQTLALTAGYTRNGNGYDFRIFDDSGENVLRLSADAIGSQWFTFRAEYELAGRSGSGLNEDLLVEIGEQPAMRHYDVADRTRNKFTGQVDVTPDERWTVSVSTGIGKDDFNDSTFGLQESTFKTVSLAADFRLSSGFGGGGSYNYERYAGLQRSRNANPGQENDPLRDWTADSAESVNYFSLFATLPRFGSGTEARVSYDFSYAEGSYLYTIPPGSPLTPPNQLPNVYNKLQQLKIDVRHRLSNRLGARVAYLYEPFRVYDFAFDPTVVDSIVQPSSLVLGYVYRPYTVHSAVITLMYFW